MAQAFDSGAFESTAFEIGGGGATNYTLTCNAGSFALSGVSASVLRSKRIVSTAGSYTQTGRSANLLRSKRFVASAGSYTQTGVSANLKRSKLVNALSGAYSLTGQNAVLTYTPGATNYTLTAQAGAFTLSGVSAIIKRSKRIASLAGAYAQSGVSAQIKRGRVLASQAGTYSLAGLDADIVYSGGPSPPVGYELTCLPGAYALSGNEYFEDGYIEPGYTAGNATITISQLWYGGGGGKLRDDKSSYWHRLLSPPTQSKLQEIEPEIAEVIEASAIAVVDQQKQMDAQAEMQRAMNDLGFAYKQAYKEIYLELVAEMRQAQEDEQIAAVVAALL